MFAHLADIISRRWGLVILIWVMIVCGVRLVAPRWDAITFDGDFAYLPHNMPSVAGQRWIETAFPQQRAKSQMAIAIARDKQPLSQVDIYIAYDVARRLKNLQGGARLAVARELASQEATAKQADLDNDARTLHEQFLVACQDAGDALDEAIRLDGLMADHWDQRVANDPSAAALRPGRLAVAYHNRALLENLLGNEEAAAEASRIARELGTNLVEVDDRIDPGQILPPFAADLPLLDVWTWKEDYFGDKLTSHDRSALLVVMQLSNELMAVDNMKILRELEAELLLVRATISPEDSAGLTIALSGSAAVGADFLRSAAASIKQTELFTILLVFLILAVVYRAPLLVAVPLVTIFVALLASTGLVALLTQLSVVPGFGWWSLKVFTTTRIFIVVILFGAGTDYCLFLIARYREELQRGLPHDQAVASALTRVGDALFASALTTILGLSMMFFADFGKFSYSGPVIGLCLAVTLITCVTLTPALIRGLGERIFWPFGVASSFEARSTARGQGPGAGHRQTIAHIWWMLARAITRRPGTILIASIVILLPLATYGFLHRNDVTYDLLNGLPAHCPSKQGAAILRQHFPVGESGPVTVLVYRKNAAFETRAGRDQIRLLSDRLHLPGIRTVRSSEDPLGEYAPGEKPGIVSPRGVRLRLLRAHPRTKAIFVSHVPHLSGNVARFELILEHDPFSLEAVKTVDHVEQTVRQLTVDSQSFWHDARFALAGTTAAIRDLRTVTQSDNTRIQLLVVLAVLIVLLVILRRPAICLFMMLSVLFSYYVTMGITIGLSSWIYGDAFHGLDWKVPLFLFVILVAIGQDYNVYLVTRVFEEQARIGPFAGLRQAVIRTGGIITSCGLIMAGTFLSMTAATWSALLPPSLAWIAAESTGALKSIVEMGFALAIGVLLDTFVIRPILLPAFLAMICRYRAQSTKTPAI